MTLDTAHQHRKMRVAAKATAAEGVVSLTLVDPDGAEAPEWEPGAHIDLEIEPDTIRQYSLCGDPADRTSLRIAVLREVESRGGSRYVHDSLQVGDLIDVKGPLNHFPLVTHPSYLFVAGGIGITPMLPMLHAADAAGAQWRLLYGGRTRAGMAFADDLAERYPDRVALRPQDEYGLLDLAAAVDETGPGTVVYCCGPEPLLLAIEDVCHARPGVELHLERFTPKATSADAVDTGFEVVLDRSDRTIEVAESETVLDALLREGIDADFSCREGTCGTCEVAVLDGVPDHRDSVLTEDEQAANDCMMVCVSRACSKKLVLDL